MSGKRNRKDTRTEKDSFGPIEVPADRLWGAQTERSRQFFRISTERMPIEVEAELWGLAIQHYEI